MGKVAFGSLLVLISCAGFVKCESHWESYAAWVLGYQWVCQPYYYTACYNWNYYGYYLAYQDCTCHAFQPYSTQCYTGTGWNCFTNCIGWVWTTLWRCQWGWKGANCDVAICDPPCRVDQQCVSPNHCDCYRGPTGVCTFEPCDDGPNANCYPGFCNKTGSWSCSCPPGFKGPNCQTITYTPDITSCKVQVFGYPSGSSNEQEVARANECAAPGIEPNTVWIGNSAANSLSRILVTWEAHYDSSIPMPTRDQAPYINNAPVPIGIALTMFSVSFPTQTAFTPQTVYCVGPARNLDAPKTIQPCSQAKIWKELGASSFVATNTSFLVNVEAHLGGQKTGDPYWVGGRFYSPQTFTPDPNLNVTVRKTKFAFDLEPPYHCLSRSNNCTVFPIFVNQSMTNNPVITPTFNEWHDDGSGLDRFHAEVYYMNLDSTGKLIPGDLIISQDVNITLNNFRFTCPTPGVYSIILTVYDKANNSARARKILNYDNHASSILETDAPIYLDRANPDTGYQFITNLEKPQNGASYLFNVIWTNHFVTSYKPEWLAQVAPWANDASGSIIDDAYLTRYGLRSIDRVFANTSILGLEIAYTVDNQTGGVGATPPLTFMALGDLTTDRYQLVIDPSLKDGDTIVVWIRVYDLYGKSYVFMSKTYVDTTRFNIKLTNQKFQKHYPDTYNSSVILTVTNLISGIKNITYEIYDESKQLSVRTGTAFPNVLEPPNSIGSRKRRDTLQIPCRPSDPTCYCVPFRQCFNKTQLINIDNCWIDRVAGDTVTVRYTIYSLSGWGLSGSVSAGVLSADDIPCRSVLSTGAIIGISIASILAFIFLVALIILLILMCIRWRVYHKHPIPAKIRTTIHNTFGRNSTPTINIMSDNEIYASKESNTELATVKKTNEKLLWTQKRWSVGPSVQQEDSFDDYLVSGKDIQINDVIDEGRFAVVRKGSLIRGNDKTPIAIKALKSGYDKKDPDVMRAKISFMANQVKPHPNIIKFIAAIDDGKDTGSPVMLLELCDKSLKDWLGELTQVDSEVLEEMLLFTLQIARGVQHLHDQKIIHRRLAVRNVLLKRGVGGYEAKLIGFGPSREDADDGRSPDESTLGLSVVPLKWMAPETLDTLNSNKPIYDEKTDAWSFAVTIWEIYSKGAAPYSNHKSQDIRAVLKRGERLTCPEYCPPELFNQTLFPSWNTNPKKRPNFTKICSNIEQFRSGFGMGDGYYPTANAGGGRPNNAGSAGYYSTNQAFVNDHVPESTAGFYHDARSA